MRSRPAQGRSTRAPRDGTRLPFGFAACFLPRTTRDLPCPSSSSSPSASSSWTSLRSRLLLECERLDHFPERLRVRRIVHVLPERHFRRRHIDDLAVEERRPLADEVRLVVRTAHHRDPSLLDLDRALQLELVHHDPREARRALSLIHISEPT